jgi:hypothetical protein
MPARTPFDRVAGVFHAADAAHHRIAVGHFERDVVERRQAGFGENDRAMIAVGAMEKP